MFLPHWRTIRKWEAASKAFLLFTYRIHWAIHLLAYSLSLSVLMAIFLNEPGSAGTRTNQQQALSLSILMAIFQVDLGYLIPECLHSGFTGAKDDGGGGDNCSKAPVKLLPPTNQHPAFSQAGCPSCRPTNGVTALKGNIYQLPVYA